MKKIETQHYPIYFGEVGYEKLIQYIEEKHYSSVFVLVDTNTSEHCLGYFLEIFPFKVEVIEIQQGEINKNLDTCQGVWATLKDFYADRHSLLINLTGGVGTDLGGFVASTYMRGIDFINIPTTLLSMVDASVGGKVGIDFEGIKNFIGVINFPKMILVDTFYLNTLPKEELCSGLAEIIKHGLIQSEKHFNDFLNFSSLDEFQLENIIFDSISIKNTIVEKDPREKSIRKTLNFGHTLGHAIETFCLENQNRKTLLHGEAIAIGMILALYLSVEILNFDREKCDFIKKNILEYFKKEAFSLEEISEIINLLKYDKKNSAGQVNFVLLEEISKPKLDCKIPNDLIYKAFEYYQS